MNCGQLDLIRSWPQGRDEFYFLVAIWRWLISSHGSHEPWKVLEKVTSPACKIPRICFDSCLFLVYSDICKGGPQVDQFLLQSVILGKKNIFFFFIRINSEPFDLSRSLLQLRFIYFFSLHPEDSSWARPRLSNSRGKTRFQEPMFLACVKSSKYAQGKTIRSTMEQQALIYFKLQNEELASELN